MVTEKTTEKLRKAAKKAMIESNEGKFPTGKIMKIEITDDYGTTLIFKTKTL